MNNRFVVPAVTLVLGAIFLSVDFLRANIMMAWAMEIVASVAIVSITIEDGFAKVAEAIKEKKTDK